MAQLKTFGRSLAVITALALAAAIEDVKERVRFCRECGNLTEEETCEICRDARRDHTIVCVVEQPADLISLERTHEFRGLYPKSLHASFLCVVSIERGVTQVPEFTRLVCAVS